MLRMTGARVAGAAFVGDDFHGQDLITDGCGRARENSNVYFSPANSFGNGRRHRWRLNHSPLFLDLLEGRTDFDCTAWAIPCYSVLGWQRPCYLRADGYLPTYRELVETTDWSRYGHASGDPACRECLGHSGFEPTAVLLTMRSPRQALRALLETAR